MELAGSNDRLSLIFFPTIDDDDRDNVSDDVAGDDNDDDESCPTL